MDINIKVTVDLSDRTVALLQPRQLEDLPEAECNCTAADMDLKTFIKETVYEFLHDLQEHAKEPVEEAKSETEQSPAPEEKAAPAASKAPASSEQAEITDERLRKAVKAAKDKVGGPSVKSLFGEFGIRNSSECPQERRSDLLARLNQLAA
jgi:hypothetical protein